MREIQQGVYQIEGKLCTRAASSGSVYGENFFQIEGEKYREWNPNRSKAAAAIRKGMDLEINPGQEILYLGAASGTTVSHFSDVLTSGLIYAVEYSEEVVRDLVELAENRENIAPILANARNPGEYSDLVEEVDVVFQDISQSDQAEIFLKNSREYLKKDGTGLLSVKAQSISSSEKPENLFDQVRQKLREEFRIVDEAELDPYETDHLFLKLERR